VTIVANCGYLPAKWNEAEAVLLETIEQLPEVGILLVIYISYKIAFVIAGKI
jgi:hypothetical protein